MEGCLDYRGKVLLECEIGLQSYCYRAATVKCFGLLRDCTNEQSCPSFPSFLTSILITAVTFMGLFSLSSHTSGKKGDKKTFTDWVILNQMGNII